MATAIKLKEGEKLYVLAARFEQARHFCNEVNVRSTALVFVNTTYQLRGIDGRGKTLYVYGSANERADYKALIDFAKERKFKIQNVKITKKV